jgi:cytochrome c biogenesis protein CcmG/thiol:disulfide interchange protein DsbE
VPGTHPDQPNLIEIAQREPAPNFKLPDIDDGTATLSDYDGQVLLLNFWATWCLPCRAEMPWFVDFQNSFGDEGFKVLGVSLDEPGWSAVRPFLERQPVNYQIALADTAERLMPFGLINILPTTWLIDRHGRIAAKHVGLVSRGNIESEIDQLVNE